ncbi:Ig-like domain-containing protein [Candidatus Formimonas warabiya]|uniref:BIG2 domain-containing protein n=1 Tax=Formimonas warabiya TaxID=1761012 RepID=A0A3G1KSZ9_FORW1|nr:hypothetical protein [Candidatus Formimonas warabiya]ATW25588.1 hypothetical protein DCMF_13215 [Candidatus Formimonas warabiya]
MKPRTWRKALVLPTAVLLLGMLSPVALAYFDRGPINVEVGQSAVTLKEGESVTVTVKVTPDSDSQLPGCGMAECPQTCGEKNCLNDDGECMCNGLEYQTYYADVKTATSDAGVATVSHNGGVVSIKGVAPGEATITVTGMLRQYREDAKTIQVTVVAKAEVTAPVVEPKPVEDSKPVTEQQSSGGKKEPDSKPVVKPVKPASGEGQKPAEDVPAAEEPSLDGQLAGTGSEDTHPSTDSAPQSEDEDTRTVMSDHGPILFVPIREDTLMGKAELEQVMGRQSSVTFEKKDEADNVLYSWSFDGQHVTAPADIDLTIRTSSQGTAELQKATKGEKALYLAFSHEGPLPGTATVYLRVQDVFANGTRLSFYYYDSQSGAARLQAENLLVENGCVGIPLEHCSQYILTEGSLAAAGSTAWIWGIIAVVVILLVIVLLVIKTKGRHKAA